MSIINHLKDADGQNIFMAVAYGLHMVSGHLTKTEVTGTDPTHVLTLQQMLGRGPWDGCEGLWWNGLEVEPDDYVFYPGIQSTGVSDPDQGVDAVFDTDTPHSGLAWLRAELGSGIGSADARGNPPVGLAGRFRTMKVQDYDEDGEEDGAIAYSTNAALQVADLILRLGRRPTSRIDWPYWCAWRDFLGGDLSYDYSLLPIDGFGLDVDFYNGVDFDTLVTSRVDPYVEFAASNGSPAVGVDAENFSARYRGLIKPKHTETYTFYITHTHGARVYIDDMVTPLIDEWSSTGTHSDTIALTADQYYDIKVEWKHTTGTAELRLEWESTSQDREVVTHRALYPRTRNRPRYETHPFFAAPTRLDDAVREILGLCNSTVQEVNGKLRFFCLEQLETTSFHFTDPKIVNGSVRVIPRDHLNLRNSWQAAFRDVENAYLEEPIDPILIERDDLIEAAGRRIDGQAINLYNCTVHQAYRTMETLVKRRCDGRFDYELTGTADSYPVLPGDAVAVDIEFLNQTAQQMLVVAANDDSSEQTADERQFTLEPWTGQELESPDEEAPTAPVLDPVTIDSDTEITLDWSASTDNIGVAGYETRIDGGSWVDRGNVLTYQYTGLTAATEYDFEVRAYDAAGNFSAASNLESGTTDAAPVVIPTTDLINDWNPDVFIGVLSDADQISSIANSATGNAATQGTSGAQPIWKENIINGHSVMRFDGSDDFLETTDPVSLREEFTLFFVYKGDADNAGMAVGGPDPRYIWLRADETQQYFGGGYNTSYTVDDHTAWGYYVFTSDGTTVKMFQNGVEKLSVTDASAEWRFQFIGKYAAGLFFDGDIARVGDYDVCKTGTDLTDLFTAIEDIYGL